MTDDELSRWIAAKLEPFARLPVPDEDCIEGWPSPRGMWLCISEYLEGAPKWEPRNFVNDPAMTIMLLEKMREWNGEPCLDNTINNGWECIVFGANSRELHETGYLPTIGRAVAEAFAMANGLGGRNG